MRFIVGKSPCLNVHVWVILFCDFKFFAPMAPDVELMVLEVIIDNRAAGCPRFCPSPQSQ